jgi:hypothetical protein
MRILDRLHCAGNGTNNPTNINLVADFGFTVSPGPASGDLLIDIPALNNEATPGSFSFSSTGTLAGTANLFSATHSSFKARCLRRHRCRHLLFGSVLAGGFLFSRERPNRTIPEHVGLT